MKKLVRWIALLPVALAAVASSRLPALGPPSNEFHFVRLAYTENVQEFGYRERWLTDWPDAEWHLLRGLRRLTRIDVAEAGELISLMDDAIYDYPFMYAVEVGGWTLDDAEAARLREYLLRGGFLVVDDFHGSREWAGFMRTMRRVFPDRTIVELPLTHPLFHVAYDIDERVQIPGINVLYSGVTYQRDGVEPHWRGIFDDYGRLMVVINFNMDLGDAWEHADVPEYALRYTNHAYQHAINQILYAMTH